MHFWKTNFLSKRSVRAFVSTRWNFKLTCRNVGAVASDPIGKCFGFVRFVTCVRLGFGRLDFWDFDRKFETSFSVERFFSVFFGSPQINQVLELIFSLTGSRNFCNGAILLFDWWMWLAAASMHHFNASVDFPNHYSNMEPSMKDEDATGV